MSNPIDLTDVKSCVCRIQRLIAAVESETDPWERSVALGEIRLTAINLFASTQEKLKQTDDPHNVGARTLHAYIIDAFNRWDVETADERAKLKLENDLRAREWSMTKEEWEDYKRRRQKPDDFPASEH